MELFEERDNPRYRKVVNLQVSPTMSKVHKGA